ncbi:MAG: hypothetical protein DSO02_02580 [Hadesarchaea archaeon]|nr:MAG: hypothetical protein DSO02_02580 [Hadesarchaea archaeon]
MRLWSLSPKYLDARGLVALWREGLLAKGILEGRLKGYSKHPQLLRFRRYKDPPVLINAYLYQVYLEAERRGYKFDVSKIKPLVLEKEVPVTRGQLGFEFLHLLEKIRKRDRKKFEEVKKVPLDKVEPHPVFKVVEGGIEEWEKSIQKGGPGGI